MFGEKDFQQLKVVTRMARDLDLGVRIVGAPIVRERDGLAMSSRNVYLSAAERAAAPLLYRVLKDTAKQLRAGEEFSSTLGAGAETIGKAGFALDYLEARHAETLAPISSLRDGPIRLLVAAKVGMIRLIDNVRVGTRPGTRSEPPAFPQIANNSVRFPSSRTDVGDSGH